MAKEGLLQFTKPPPEFPLTFQASEFTPSGNKVCHTESSNMSKFSSAKFSYL